MLDSECLHLGDEVEKGFQLGAGEPLEQSNDGLVDLPSDESDWALTIRPRNSSRLSAGRS